MGTLKLFLHSFRHIFLDPKQQITDTGGERLT